LGVNSDLLKREVDAAAPRALSRFKAPRAQFSQLAQSVLKNGEYEAELMTHQVVGPEHVLLGFARVPNTSVARALAKQGVSLEKMRPVIAEIGGRRQRPLELVKTPERQQTVAGHDAARPPVADGERRQRQTHRQPKGSPTGEGNYAFSIVWDPSVVDGEDYARLVRALGNLARASGGIGVQREGTDHIVVRTEVGVLW
jgi:ATP-dependent Clp protease ATP-binding subunit ClpA